MKETGGTHLAGTVRRRARRTAAARTSGIARRAPLAAAALAAALAACADVASPPLVPPDAVVPPDSLILPDSVWPSEQWAGGLVTVAPLRVPGSDTTVYVGTAPVERVFRRGDSLTVRLPGTANGVLELRLGSPAGKLLGRVRVAGFAGDEAMPLRFDDGNEYLYPWPRGGVASLIGSHEKNVVQYLPGSGEVRPLLSGYPLCCGYARAPGPTPDTAVFLFHPLLTGGPTPVEAWRLLPTPTLVRRFPFSAWMTVMQMSDSTFLVTSSHTQTTYKLRADTLVLVNGQCCNNYEFATTLYLSPRHDRATMRHNGSHLGVPVYDPATADTVYVARQLRASYGGAAFSPAGDTLYLSGEGYVGGSLKNLVLAVDAATGQELARHDFGAWMAHDMIADGPWLFVAAHSGLALRMFVFERRTMRLAGMLDTPVNPSTNEVSIATGSDGIFLVETYPGQRVFRFDRLK